ncbi:MAG: hypothetical protein ACK2T2_01290 [Anaerolineales bacterium]
MVPDRWKSIKIAAVLLLLFMLVLSGGCQVVENLPQIVDEIPGMISDLGQTLAGATPTPTGPLPAAVIDQIKALPDVPTEENALGLRANVVDILRSANTSGQSSTRAVANDLIERLASDSTLFLDKARFTERSILEHDLDLAGRLVSLLRVPNLDPGLLSAYQDALIKLLLADRLIVDAVTADATIITRSAESLSEDQLSPVGVESARTELERMQTALEQGREAWRLGEPLNGLGYLMQAWDSSAAVRAVWGIRYNGDFDDDGVSDLVELGYGASPMLLDSDLDGLSDYYEATYTAPWGSPGKADTDGDGVLDGDEDLDFDGLVTALERDLGSDPMKLDTDGDGIGDMALLLGPDMGAQTGDTDGDGLSDESEARLGTDPKHVDSDRDGVPDSQEFHLQILEFPDLGVTVDLYGMGDQSEALKAERMVGAPGFAGNIGAVGDFVRLTTPMPVQLATIHFHYDETKVPGGDEANVRLFVFNEAEGVMYRLADPIVDPEQDIVSGKTTMLGPVGVLYLPIFQAVVPGHPAIEIP